MKKTNKRRNLFLVAVAIIICISFVGCGGMQNFFNDVKGSLVGVSYTVDFYDNYGAKFLTAFGEKIDIDGNVVESYGVDSDGSTTTNYDLSSVITITIDGAQMSSCGSTVIFTESGLKPDVEFTLSDINSDSNDLTDLTSVSKVVNEFKNYFGKPVVVVIQSQLGVPITAYSGNDVYWEIPDDLPKMTKLMIDGKALYIHRSNFVILDKNLMK